MSKQVLYFPTNNDTYLYNYIPCPINIIYIIITYKYLQM